MHTLRPVRESVKVGTRIKPLNLQPESPKPRARNPKPAHTRKNPKPKTLAQAPKPPEVGGLFESASELMALVGPPFFTAAPKRAKVLGFFSEVPS